MFDHEIRKKLQSIFTDYSLLINSSEESEYSEFDEDYHMTRNRSGDGNLARESMIYIDENHLSPKIIGKKENLKMVRLN